EQGAVLAELGVADVRVGEELQCALLDGIRCPGAGAAMVWAFAACVLADAEVAHGELERSDREARARTETIVEVSEGAPGGCPPGHPRRAGVHQWCVSFLAEVGCVTVLDGPVGGLFG